MSYILNPPAQWRLKSFFGEISKVLRHAAQRASFAMYASGILGEGERKSVEPIAARACGKQVHDVDATHQRLLHFIGPAQWSDSQVRLTAARYALKAMTQRGPVVSAIVDDTGFLKQGHHSVGVKRQYTGSAGKVTNCQVAVSLTLATQTDHVPVDMQLYLPDTWAHDPDKREEGHIPQRYRTEQMYEETKGGLGLDHYEGRRYPGWNHHVSVVLSCYSFIVAERVRHFPPSVSRADQGHAQRLAA